MASFVVSGPPAGAYELEAVMEMALFVVAIAVLVIVALLTGGAPDA